MPVASPLTLPVSPRSPLAATSPLPFSPTAGSGAAPPRASASGRRASTDLDRMHPPPAAHLNRNAEWVSTAGGWAFILVLLALGWLASAALLGDAGKAWTAIHLAHGALTFYLFHWMKGSPVGSDQGKYDGLTFWEQLDDGVQNTATRKFLIFLPALIFALASHGSDYSAQPLGLNLVVLAVLLVAKLPAMHTVRLFGINRW